MTFYANECEAFADARRSRSSGTTVTQWISGLFARSPKAINEKRERLLSKSRSSSRSSTARSSFDVESQGSDSSTLNEFEREKKAVSSKIDARMVSDAIIGLSDGLTVPFALTAGLSALGNTRVVIFAGLAELTAGAISMGLGGYLAAKSEEDSSTATLNETRALVARDPFDAASSIRDVLEPYDLPCHLTEELTMHLTKSPNLVQFLMHFQHNQPEQTASRALTCAITIACGYFLGGFLPLIPYFLVGKEQVMLALWWSFVFMTISLFAFGYCKTCFSAGWSSPEHVWSGTKGGMQMILVGGTAAVCAMSLVRFFDTLAA